VHPATGEDVIVSEDLDGIAEELPPIRHDDIMQRLLAYQRRLQDERARGGPGVATATEELLDLGIAEVERDAQEPGPLGPASSGDLPTRVTELESTLDRLDRMLGELRRRFQELAVVVDERIATVRQAVEQARREERQD